MPKKENKNIVERKDEVLGKHFRCGGVVKLKRTNLDSVRYCEKCGSSNDKEGPVFTHYEASFWK